MIKKIGFDDVLPVCLSFQKFRRPFTVIVISVRN